MTISNITVKDEMGAAGCEATFVTKIRFSGPADYADGGLDESSVLRAAIGNKTPLAVIPERVIAGTTKTYEPRIMHEAATVQSVAAAWPVADQDGNTITYKLNGGNEATLTLSGAHTTAAALAASMNAISGIHAYVDDTGQVTAKTDRTGEDATLEITGGTANAVYLFPTAEATGNNTPRLAIFDAATGLDVGLNDPSLDLSAYIFECTLLAK